MAAPIFTLQFASPVQVSDPVQTSNVIPISGTFNFQDGTGSLIVQLDDGSTQRIDAPAEPVFVAALTTRVLAIVAAQFGQTPTVVAPSGS
jgi:hypothetical protein